jgi:FkbM family methyltransferase
MYRIVKTKTVIKLLKSKNDLKEKYRILNLIREFATFKGNLNRDFLNYILSGDVKSQNLQDLKTLQLLSNKKNGYYVEFGADDGVQNSNSYFLNKIFGWSGLLAEPNPERFKELKRNRPNDCVSNALIWREKDVEIEFTIAGQLSTISDFVESDFMKDERKSVSTKKMKFLTTDLESVLKNANAPKYIDFLSIDTEGSEFDILEKFNFDKYIFNVICVEHNNNEENKNKLDSLFTRNGYKQDLNFAGGVDAFYVYHEN